MALIPDICVAWKTNCSILVVKDITDSYNADTNVGGWQAPNITTSDVASATITIETPEANILEPTDVLDSLPATVTGEFLLSEIDIPALDGEWTITYEITTNTDVVYTKVLKVFSACIVRCCIDKMWSKYAENAANSDCDCGCSDCSNKTALQAEALYRAMLSSTACLNSATRTKILSKIQRLCELEECNCG